ncbi:f-box-like domain-containing protein [Ditylenchus destructor]|uniref:F-box-like domain-containing protein n=1 Tax=Ditylenchus destructor TaxID=166010 RepID=A0AAD4MNT2_9BILA|nr:f-box-like domain-containing protein [Ditylenchus destructor]
MQCGTNINELPDMILAQIFVKLPWQERLEVEQVCKKWHNAGKHHSWTNFRIFNNYKYRDWTEERVTEIKPFFDRCGRHLRHLQFHGWSSETVLSFIRTAPNVQHLKFCDVELNDESLKMLAQIVPNLKSLGFEGSLRRAERNIGHGLMECFKMMTCLEYLYIIDDGVLLHQHSFVQFPPNLKFFSLNGIKNTDQILNWVAKGCKDLKALCVSGVYGRINESGFQAISQMKNLTYLDLPIDRADNFDIGYVFEALIELRALKIDTVDVKVSAAIARYCEKLEHLHLDTDDISPKDHANLLRVASLPNFCSLAIWASSYPKEQTTELVNRQWQTSDFYGKICQVVDEIDESDRQQSKFPKEEHPIVEVQYQGGFCGHLSTQHKWLRLKNTISSRPNAWEKWQSEKWQYGWLRAGKP